MVAEFANRKRTISKLRDDIDKATNKNDSEKTIQKLLDAAQLASDRLNKCAPGFDAIYKIHYGNKEPM